MRWILGFLTRLVGTIMVITFLLSCAIEISIPGGFRSVVFPQGVPPEELRTPRMQALVDTYDLDNNVVERWLKWLFNAVQGDLGISNDRGRTEVLELLAPRFSISIQLMTFAAVLAIGIGIPLGVFAALKHERRTGTVMDGFIGVLQSLPLFVVPPFLIWIFAINLQWLPAAGWVRISDSFTGNLKGMLMPGVALALPEIGFVARVIKSDVSEVLQADYITAAIGKGLSPRYVLFRHALPPASLGLLNVIGLNIGALLSGTFVVELIFGIGALGNVFLGALLNRDLHLILAMTVYIVSVYVILNSLVDLLMKTIDPRIRVAPLRSRPWYTSLPARSGS